MLPHEKEAEREAFRKMPLKKKLQHFFTYYTFPTLAVIGGILCAAVLIWHFFFRPIDVNTFIVGVCSDVFSEAKKDEFCNEIRDLLDAHEPNQVVRIDDNYNLSLTQDQVRMSVLTAAGEYAMIVSSKESFEELAANGYFENLEEILSKDVSDKLSPYFIRTEGLLETESTTLEDRESGRGEPLNYGISLKECPLWQELGGSLEDPIAGIPVSAESLDNAVVVLKAMFNL